MLLVAFAATEEDIEAVPVVPVVIHKQVDDADGPGVILTIDKSVTLPSSEESSEAGETSQGIFYFPAFIKALNTGHQ